MSIKSGQILHDASGFVVDRIQTGGVSSLNIPEEKIYELGNYETVAIVRDIPDLSFDMESLDVTCEIEALLTGVNPTTTIDGDEFDFVDNKPMHVISPFKSTQGAFNIVKGIVIPGLTLESATYRFGVRQNSTQSFTLKGDSVYYIPGTPYYQTFAAAGVGPYTITNTAIKYVESGADIYVLGVCEVLTDGTYKKLFHGLDYTNTSTSFTLATAPTVGSILHVVYGSLTSATYPQSVHQNVSVKPAAVRGKDIDVYFSDGAATPTFERWTSVQSFEVTRRVNLENDEEFGNSHYVAQDYVTAEVSGTIAVKPRDTTDLFTKIAQAANVPTTEVVGPFSSSPIAMELRISDPDTGDLLKTLYVPDARVTIPSIQGQVQQKLTVSFPFTSDGGTLKVYQGAR